MIWLKRKVTRTPGKPRELWESSLTGCPGGFRQGFRPNIKRIKRHFVCVLTGHDKISDGLDLLMRNYLEIIAGFEKGGERGFLDWRDP